MDQPSISHAFSGVSPAALALGLVISIATQIILIWLVSKLITPSTGTFWNAVRQYVFSLVLVSVAAIVMLILGVIVVVAAHPSHPAPWLFVLLLLAFTALILVSIYAAFAITMKVYDISAARAFVFKVVFFVVSLCLLPVTNMLTPRELREDRVARTQELSKAIKAFMDQKTPAPQTQPASPSVTPPAPTPPSIPLEVTLTEPVQIQMIVNGQAVGTVTVNKGTRVKLLSVNGDQLKIKYLDTVTNIPRKSTDLPDTQP